LTIAILAPFGMRMPGSRVELARDKYFRVSRSASKRGLGRGCTRIDTDKTKRQNCRGEYRLQQFDRVYIAPG
jgi:hypothetical protein